MTLLDVAVATSSISSPTASVMSDGERPVSLSIQMRTNSSVVMPGCLVRSSRSAVFSRAERWAMTAMARFSTLAVCSVTMPLAMSASMGCTRWEPDADPAAAIAMMN